MQYGVNMSDYYGRVDTESIEIESVDSEEFIVCYAELNDGTILNDDQLSDLTDEMHESGEMDSFVYDEFAGEADYYAGD